MRVSFLEAAFGSKKKLNRKKADCETAKERAPHGNPSGKRVPL